MLRPAGELSAPQVVASQNVILNHMVQYRPVVHHRPELDRPLAALADSNRRLILQQLGQGSATVTELAEPFGMSLTGLKKHLQVLEEVGLVSTEKVGRTRICSLGPRRLDDVQQWIEAYRVMLDERLDRLGELIEGAADEAVTSGEIQGPASREPQ
ncbi:MAG TPA: metalloregulator ArsR/SmtB family transcription factor [Solirubrobacteraceae bacterium]|jgi:DNA-binding transcriptional ArsR family regulator|nr:metalloregulator ArsR/SmtB family transcription factor [Solirubrobacteraceae bacterium]